jgi:hypothetical protein
MKRSDIVSMPPYFDRYINLVEDLDLIEALEKYGPAFLEREKERFEQLGDKVYAPGKWTIKDLLQHLIDAERVFVYRAMRFARNDKTELPGFDEDAYAAHANTQTRSVADLLEEFSFLRRSTILFYKTLDAAALQREGVASGNKISVLALGFTICGHPAHHMNVIRERYYPLLS